MIHFNTTPFHLILKMTNQIYTIHTSDLNTLNASILKDSLAALESGNVLYFPQYAFTPLEAEKTLISENILHPKRKNISYDYRSEQLAGIHPKNDVQLSQNMSAFMHRYSQFAKQLIDDLLPLYSKALIWGRTSYRPAEIKNRKTSPRKDDTRVHVDAFPATPVNGLRILRVFCNINPYAAPRVWELGESFSQVVKTFNNTIPPYSPFRSKLLLWIKATKSLRSHYDHFMLHLHDNMKLDQHYQKTIAKQRVEFPAQSTWIVFTDQVSHAALAGQHLLEQTFYLPVEAMQNPQLSPLKHWESSSVVTHAF